MVSFSSLITRIYTYYIKPPNSETDDIGISLAVYIVFNILLWKTRVATIDPGDGKNIPAKKMFVSDVRIGKLMKEFDSN